MKPDPTHLLEKAMIFSPLIGLYDVADPQPFAPFVETKRCYFANYENWMRGESICFTRDTPRCRGGSYWIGGVEFTSRDEFGSGLNQREGFKSTDAMMCQWLDNQPPYQIENGYGVIGPLVESQYHYLKTITFYVNPDQLSLLMLGAEYQNASPEACPVKVVFGSGCGQLAAVFGDLDAGKAQAVIGATDIAMREYLPADILAFTVNKPMFEQLCALGEESFLHKHFWQRLLKARGIVR